MTVLSPINIDEYRDPELYDLENQGFEPAGPFYLSLAQQAGGAVLELGCGTGRYTIPIAEQGIDITGLDLVPEMLERAKSKAGSLSIPWIQADARSFHLGHKFNLIFESGAMFQHLLKRGDQEQMLACVREHLADDGNFVVTLPIYSEDWMATVTEEQPWFSYTTPAGIEVKVSGTQHYDPVHQVKVETAYRRWREPDGKEVVKVAPLSLRQTFPAELEALLHENHFEILARYGDWQLTPFDRDSHLLICLCRNRILRSEWKACNRHFTGEISPATPADIAEMAVAFPDWGARHKHEERWQQQEQGKAVYLVARQQGQPVGHANLKWQGAGDLHVVERRTMPCPDIEDIFVLGDWRGKGIGSALIGVAEELTVRQGFQHIGLSVGIENPAARRLYERLGYQDAGFGEYTEHGTYLDAQGQSHSWEERCVYLIKEVA